MVFRASTAVGCGASDCHENADVGDKVDFDGSQDRLSLLRAKGMEYPNGPQFAHADLSELTCSIGRAFH
jgi:hypothetical protein